MENLFHSQELTFEKEASEVELPEDPNSWPQEITQELYKQAPFISDFEPHVVMDRVDAEKLYGFGHVEISSRSEMPMGASGGPAAGVKTVRVPVIVNQGKLQPFDVLVTEDSKMMPLTEGRLRQAVFRPQTFDVTSKTPGDHSMVGQLFPPQRMNSAGGGTGMTYSPAGMGKEGAPNREAMRMHIAEDQANTMRMVGQHQMADKAYQNMFKRTASMSDAELHGHYKRVQGNKSYKTASVTSLLAAVLPTARQSDLDKFASAFNDRSVCAGFVKNKFANAQALRLVQEAEQGQKLASPETYVRATVVQLTHSDGGGYKLKTANPDFWDPKIEELDRGEAVRRFGEKIVLAADLSAGVTSSEGETVEADSPEADDYELIKDYGLYKVKSEDGQDLVGWVFPNLIDLDGKALPLALFTNGSVASVQGEIVGVRAGEGMALPQGGRPRGHGCFYRVLPNGKAEATLPFTVNATMGGDGGASFQAETFDGQTVNVIGLQPNLQSIQLVDGDLLVPEDFHWLPLDSANEVALMSEPSQPGQEQEMKEAFAKVTIRHDGGLFSLSGLPVEKIASSNRSFMSMEDTMFMLAGMGAGQKYAEQKLVDAISFSQPVEIKIARVLTTAEEQRASSRKLASATLAKLPSLKVNLVKEAAAIPDPLAVDTVLSVGFLNPENANVFLEGLPTLEKAQERMCELLIATRLGMRDIPVSALENAIRSVEEVLEGLKVMAFEQS